MGFTRLEIFSDSGFQTGRVFNALNDTNFTDPDAIEFNTIEDAVYMGMKNDVSFILMGTMNFFEQQFSWGDISVV